MLILSIFGDETSGAHAGIPVLLSSLRANHIALRWTRRQSPLAAQPCSHAARKSVSSRTFALADGVERLSMRSTSRRIRRRSSGTSHVNHDRIAPHDASGVALADRA